MKKIKDLIIYIIVIIALVLLTPLGIVYTALKSILKFTPISWGSKILSYFTVMVVALDQYCNVLLQDLFNDMLIKDSRKDFGDPHDTIRYVLEYNHKKENLTLLGKLLYVIIEH
jgi:hypothetical protein